MEDSMEGSMEGSIGARSKVRWEVRPVVRADRSHARLSAGLGDVVVVHHPLDRRPLDGVLGEPVGHNYMNHNYIGHNYIGHGCI